MESKSNNTQACRETGKVEAPFDGKLSMVVIVNHTEQALGCGRAAFPARSAAGVLLQKEELMMMMMMMKSGRRILDEGRTCLHGLASGSCQSNNRC